MVWNGAYCAFAVETFFKTGESVITTLRVFHAHFRLCQNDAVMDRKSILVCNENFRTTGSSVKRKSTRKNERILFAKKWEKYCQT